MPIYRQTDIYLSAARQSPSKLATAKERSGRTLTIFQQIEATVTVRDLPEPDRKRVWEQVNACAECHRFSLAPGEHGPSLLRVWGRQVGVSDWDGYSGALAARGGVWTETRLAAYIDDPARWAPGSSMPDPGIDDPRLLAGLATLLRRLEEDGE